MKDKVAIICSSFLDENGVSYKIGGVETYIRNLARLLIKNNFEVTIFQYAKSDFIIKKEYGEIHGIATNSINFMIKVVEQEIDKDYTVIFATDYLVRKNKFKKTVAIQHGIAWDICKKERVSIFKKSFDNFRKSLSAIKKMYFYSFCRNIVCVDYNFINWYRTQTTYNDINFYPIPNFTEIPKERLDCRDSVLKIIFARRFVEYRGTLMFANVVEQLLLRYSDIHITFAGNGPLKKMIKERFECDSRVSIQSYDADESLQIHAQYDIAVVPTLGSEGTSLSLLEAMASECAVIATNVGGMTNIILDGFNGILINPNEKELYDALNILINDSTYRKELSKNALLTVENAFSKEKWEKRWLNIMNDIGENSV